MATRSKQKSIDLLEQEVGAMIRRIRSVMHERARTVHPELSTQAYLLLSYLAEKGAMRSSDIADRFGIDKGAISRQVQHLCTLGLIGRSPDPDDGRAHKVAVTDKGRQRLDDTARERRVLLEQRLQDWTAEELAGFVDDLARYNTSLDPTTEAAAGTPVHSASSR